MLDELTGRLAQGADLALEEMTSAIDAMMRGAAAPEAIAAFLIALRKKGETVDEIAGAALALRQHMTCISTRPF